MKRVLTSLAALLAIAAAAPATPAAAQTEVTYLLPAAPFLPAFGPWMVAQQRGYYAAEGLKVTFQAARGGVDAAKQLGAGNAVIGGGIGDTSILVRPNGVPVRAVAVLGGGSLMQLVINKDKVAGGIKDLKGKVVTTMAFQDTTYYALLGMLATQGMTRNDVNAQAAGPVNTWKLFVAGQADAMAAVPDWTAEAIAAGMKLEIIPSDTHFKSMAQAIIAADETIRTKPELIGKLVSATLKGMKAIMDDADAAAIDYVKAVPQHAGKEQAMAAVFKLYNRYVYPGQAKLGQIDEGRLAALQDFYVKEGFIPQASPVKDLYTNQFVN